MKRRFIALYLLLFATALLFTLLKTGAAPTMKPLTEIPQKFGEWRMLQQDLFKSDMLEVLRPTDYLSRTYGNEKGDIVRLYIGFHDGSDKSGPIHSPKHCLPGNGFTVISEEKLQIPAGRVNLNLVQSLYQKDGEKELFLYWFQLREKSVTNEYSLKLEQLLNSVMYKRRDASFVRISIPITTDKNASSRIAQKFIADFYPLFVEIMPL